MITVVIGMDKQLLTACKLLSNDFPKEILSKFRRIDRPYGIYFYIENISDKKWAVLAKYFSDLQYDPLHNDMEDRNFGFLSCDSERDVGFAYVKFGNPSDFDINEKVSIDYPVS